MARLFVLLTVSCQKRLVVFLSANEMHNNCNKTKDL